VTFPVSHIQVLNINILLFQRMHA